MPTTRHDTRLTYEDLLLFPEDGLRHEIIDGEHYVTPAPIPRHQDLVLRLGISIGTYLEDRPDRGIVFIAPLDIVFSFHDVVEPDVIFLTPDQLDMLTDKNLSGAPAMVVEVLSPSTRKRDERIKLRLYERSGVREYWMIDPEANDVTIHRRADDGTFPLIARLSADARDTLRTPLLPEWSLDLSRLFRQR
jgi:Uma2 family endonuclease